MCEVVWWKKREATADANSDRIERQKQYLAALEEKRQSSFERIRFLLTLYQKIKDFSVTNLSAARSDVSWNPAFSRVVFRMPVFLSIKGEASMGETYAEFHVDEQANV